jgi:hypothetical protein
MTTAAGSKEAPRFTAGAGREHKDGISIDQRERNVAPLCLSGGSDSKPITLVHPGSGALVTDKYAPEPLILQTEAVVV